MLVFDPSSVAVVGAHPAKLRSTEERLVRIRVGGNGVELDHTESVTASPESQSMHETIMNNVNNKIDLALSRQSRRYYYLHT